jgi:hypothetical protein
MSARALARSTSLLLSGGLLLGGLLAACSTSPPCVEVEVSWSGYAVPDDLDQLHFELSDEEGVFVERGYTLPDDAPPASIALCRGARTPAELSLVVYGMRDSSAVTQSPPETVSFEPAGERYQVELP